jgi:hypothetical protein
VNIRAAGVIRSDAPGQAVDATSEPACAGERATSHVVAVVDQRLHRRQRHHEIAEAERHRRRCRSRRWRAHDWA